MVLLWDCSINGERSQEYKSQRILRITCSWFCHSALYTEEFLTSTVSFPGTLLYVLGFVSALTVSVLDKVGTKQLGLDGVIQQESKVVGCAQTACSFPSFEGWPAWPLLLQCREACSGKSCSWPEEGIIKSCIVLHVCLGIWHMQATRQT